MGARGVLLEDQTWPKRCGHMEGKSGTFSAASPSLPLLKLI